MTQIGLELGGGVASLLLSFVEELVLPISDKTQVSESKSRPL